jgi:hypothetical protein
MRVLRSGRCCRGGAFDFGFKVEGKRSPAQANERLEQATLGFCFSTLKP